ncbi:L-tryptophan--pyruvate aminotransferase 1-like [Solanum stenotomum]|uniref:L-tryptophan--pyruvate aminotransferase 1-like n=1 Tax=Solanum stenotomum TaxID=172797 RepID=UPI0020D13DD8|nr:L-tryptophan--pyruvate aminotransferase 1-like [Solanum stenotomum]
MDVKTAFLRGDLDEEIYMEQPEGFEVKGKDNYVCKLKKSLYGLKQAPMQWYRKFGSYMSQQGFKKTSSDHCVFVQKFSDHDFIIILLYVDDMLVVGHNACRIKELKEELNKSFAMINDIIISLKFGDPTMYKSYWQKMCNKCNITFNGDDSLSYFATGKSLCWFLESKLKEQLKRLHNVVGNAIVDDHYIVVGTRSSQLVQAVLYALSPSDQLEPISVVSATPFYSTYPYVTNLVRSGLNKWAGDLKTFEKDEPFIELITSPNNPNGIIREHVVNGDQGKLIYDLAFYWQQYTSITPPANNDVMLFTISKCTGHASSIIGWALVKDKEVARKMTRFMEICTIGVSKEAQLRDAKLLEVVSNSCLDFTLENFLEYSQSLMDNRWFRLRQDRMTTMANAKRNEEDIVGQEVPPQDPIDPLGENVTNTEMRMAFQVLAQAMSAQSNTEILLG